MMLDKLKALKEGLVTAFERHKMQPLEIFVRHCHYSNVSAHKQRHPNFSRLKCMENLLSTMERENCNLTFFLDTFHPVTEPHFLESQNQFPVIKFKAGSEAASFLYMLEYVYQKKYSSDTIIYFLEDDYLHRPGWTKVLREAFVIPGIHYVTLYDHLDKYFLPQYENLNSKIFYTNSCHWRTTPSTTNTYAMLFDTLKKDVDIHRMFSLGRTITADHEKFCKLAEKGAKLVSSLPGYATHAEPKYASPCHEWGKNFL